ncbi:succinyl-diaminopimelate desuccinylase [Mycobacterium kansasii 824]|uniref:Succinyl-diaminopimelate desuccinylase n=1 Tax=Mycobacterium kansasii TaxID=1768 RepID=A0A1V3XJC4_MYCKA|nr:succinyl-diaminopimelate desuccinylase [Mycobacterium kansasii 824]OOK79242.1 succinyl-diaminopimelate desuccinylase [Mycobacterium kansasii]
MLDLRGDPIALTAALVDIPSESRNEARIADEVEAALRAQTTGFEIIRNGNAVLARTSRNRPSRVLLAGHLDTVPPAGNLPSRLENGELYGCGTADMKSGDAVFLHLAATVAEPVHDLTLVFYDCEEIEAAANGLGRIENELRDWLSADVAILGEPTAGYIEAGCQGTLRVVISATGTRAHSARSWLGDNAIHKLGAVLDRLARYQARSVDIDGCTYREGLSAVRVDGGVAGNVIPDRASVTVNYRFAPTGRWPRPCSTSTRCSTGWTCRSSRRTPPRVPCPGCRSRPPKHWSRPPVGRSGRSTGGPTCRASRRWASPRSTTDPVIPIWRTGATSGFRPPRSRWPSTCCGNT